MWDILLDVLFKVAEWVVGMLPTYNPSNTGMIQSLLNALGFVNQWFPISEMVDCLISWLVFCTMYVPYRMMLKWARLA